MQASEWELTILDAATNNRELNAVAAGDVDGDGHVELLFGGLDGVAWYRPDTRERGRISPMHTGVGGVLLDVDGDGVLEFIVSEANAIDVGNGQWTWRIYWFKPPSDLSGEWMRHVIDPNSLGQAHDLIVADIDGDGHEELIANAVYSSQPGLYAYKPKANVYDPWTKIRIQSGIVEEGLAAGDLDGDGQAEIVSGPDWYHAPKSGPLSDDWERHVYAPSHREMCRVAVLDVAGNGRPDIFAVDSEYLDGHLSHFRNRLVEDPSNPWIEQLLQDGLTYAHSLGARTAKDGSAQVFCGEMGQGGWGAPRNFDARVIEFVSSDKGATWRRTLVSKGEGTHEDQFFDVDNDGEAEIVGKDPFECIEGALANPRVHVFKKVAKPSPLTQFSHRFLDRDKPGAGIDLLVGDIDKDGLAEIVCGQWWYKLDGDVRQTIPGIHQAIALHDIDDDGILEIIATKPATDAKDFWNTLTSNLVWLKAVDLAGGAWEEHPIGTGNGNWPHGTLVAPLLPGGKLAMVTGYHSASQGARPEIWEIPDNPASHPWPKRVLADIQYGEEFVACDVNRDGLLDIVAGAHWLENLGDGTFKTHTIGEGFKAARVAVADIDGDGWPDVLLGEEIFHPDKPIVPRSALAWFENPGDDAGGEWKRHVIDTVRCAHSVALADLDGDGEPEVICGEHDPFWPYRSKCRLLIYKKADPAGLAWKRFIVDDRFEHHDGTKIVPLPNGRLGIASHGWRDTIYVNLWEPAQ